MVKQLVYTYRIDILKLLLDPTSANWDVKARAVCYGGSSKKYSNNIEVVMEPSALLNEGDSPTK